MHLTRLRYFVVTAEEESIVGASRRLRVAQPALSRQLAALEREVGTPLFERHARGVRLLPAGVAFLTHARRLLAEADRGLLAARNAVRRSASAHLRLASPDWPVRAAWIARAVDRLRTLHPEVEVEHDATLWVEHETAVRNGAIDVGFAIAMGPEDFGEDLEIDRICDEPASVAILSATHELADRPSVTLADLRDVTLLAPSRDKVPRLHDQSVAVVRAAGYEPRVALGSPSFAATVQLAAAGAGWVIAVNSTADAIPRNVRAIPIADASLVLGFYLLRHRGNRNEAAAEFVKCLHAIARSETASKGLGPLADIRLEDPEHNAADRQR
jgi:DNA-binding transcriptional LysR family regulator